MKKIIIDCCGREVDENVIKEMKEYSEGNFIFCLFCGEKHSVEDDIFTEVK